MPNSLPPAECECTEGKDCPAPDIDTSIHRLGMLEEVRWERCYHGTYIPIYLDNGRIASIIYYEGR